MVQLQEKVVEGIMLDESVVSAVPPAGILHHMGMPFYPAVK